jgi:hypothetical protein
MDTSNAHSHKKLLLMANLLKVMVPDAAAQRENTIAAAGQGLQLDCPAVGKLAAACFMTGRRLS